MPLLKEHLYWALAVGIEKVATASPTTRNAKVFMASLRNSERYPWWYDSTLSTALGHPSSETIPEPSCRQTLSLWIKRSVKYC